MSVVVGEGVSAQKETVDIHIPSTFFEFVAGLPGEAREINYSPDVASDKLSDVLNVFRSIRCLVFPSCRSRSLL